MFSYARTMGRFVEWADAEGIVPADIELFDVEDYLGSLTQQNGEPYSAHSLRTYCKDVRTLLNFAHDRKIFADRIKVDLPKTEDSIEALSDAELEIVLPYFEDQAAADSTNFEGLRNAGIVHMLKDAGLRVSELLALNWTDISWDPERQIGTIQVTKQMNRKREMVSPKNGKDRVTFFYADTWKWLELYKVEEGLRMIEIAAKSTKGWSSEGWDQLPFDTSPGRPIFWLSYGDPERLGHAGLGKLLRNAGKKLGIRLYPHLFRHTAGRLLTKAGVTPIALMQLLGHSSMTMVLRYGQLWGEDLEDVVYQKMVGNGKH
ncbi:MAG: site-specific integrase [Anaerolineales bacterium]